MADEYEILKIEPRGDDYILIREDSDRKITEIILSESNVVFLGRLAPTVARRIVASKSPASGVEVSVAAPAKNFELNSDLHNDLVLLRIRDEHDSEFDFSFEPAGARYLGQRLMAWADKIDAATKPKKQ